jgi:hypothetical protein
MNVVHCCSLPAATHIHVSWVAQHEVNKLCQNLLYLHHPMRPLVGNVRMPCISSLRVS